MDKIVEFTGRVIRKVYGDSAEFRIYAVDVSEEQIEKQKLKKTKYGSVSILGALHELGEGLEYNIKAKEENGKNGYSYKVINITRNRPQTSQDFYEFLHEILTPLQANAVWSAYPDIVQRVIDNRLDDIDFDKMFNIRAARFESIKQKIIDNYALAELIQEFKGLLSMSVLQQIYNKYTSIQAVREALKTDPYRCLCQLSGVGFRTADNILQELEREGVINFGYELKTSKQRCLACIMYLLEENEVEGHTLMDIIELRQQVMKLTPACAHLFVDALKSEDIYYDKDKMITALKRTYETEKFIADKVKEALNINKVWNIDTSKYKTVNGCALSEEQQSVTSMVCKNQISILNGSGGCGKSFTTQSVINMCLDNNKTFQLMSPTGRAAKVLADYTKQKATTIHRGLDNIMFTGEGDEIPLLDCDLLIVDEFSMTDIFLFKYLIRAIDFNTTKLLLVGDNAQLPSVGAGNLLHDFMQSKKIPTVTLTKVFRYGDGGVSKIATDIRNCVKYLVNIVNPLTYFGKNKDYAFLNVDDSVLVKNALALYQKVFSEQYQKAHGLNLKVSDVQVLTSKNVGDCGTDALNNELQKIANPNYGSSDYMKIGDKFFFKDDLVMQTKNNYRAELYTDNLYMSWTDDGMDSKRKKEVMIANGETGTIIEINVKEQYVIIDFDGVKVKYNRTDLQSVSLGYAITIHKSQGGSIPIVILLTPKAHTFMLNSNLLYVGVSRTKVACYHLGNQDTINQCIRKKANFARKTFMQSLLTN